MSAAIKPAKPRIEVYQYLGYHGAFAMTRTLLWRCEVIGVNGERWHGGSWMQEGCGTLHESSAEDDAKRWAAFTGWPVKRLGRAPQHDDNLREYRR